MPFWLMLGVEPVSRTVARSWQRSSRARIDGATHTLDNTIRNLKVGLFPEYRQEPEEFVSGNTLFALPHELTHAVVTKNRMPRLGGPDRRRRPRINRASRLAFVLVGAWPAVVEARRPR